MTRDTFLAVVTGVLALLVVILAVYALLHLRAWSM